jgi:hypothetical protein
MEAHVIAGDYVEPRFDQPMPAREAHSSGVSWGAVFAGAFVAAAFYLILLALGAGLGLSAISPWSGAGASASTFGTVAILWLICIEIIASGLGGYLTGRLRTKWALVHTDEVYFRDTANGFVAWAVALIVSVTVLASTATYMAGRIAPAAPVAAVSGETAANNYYVDTLFRSDRAGAVEPATAAEAASIFTKALAEKVMPGADQSYLAGLIAARTGMSRPDAEKRIDDVFARAQQAEDTARKDTAHFLLWSFLALAMGAFSASFAATVGGRQRDHVKAV